MGEENQLISPASSSGFREILNDVVASAFGSAACVYTGLPFDTVKVRLQCAPTKFTGVLPCIRKTITEDGVFALWRGSIPALIGALSENVVAFGTNGIIKRIIGDFDKADENGKKQLTWTPIIAGSLTGALTSFVLCPCDILKCRSQVHIAKGLATQSLLSMTKEIIHSRGWRGLYTGLSWQLMRDVPFYGTFFGSYEILCQLFKNHTDWSEPAIYFISGGLAGQIGWIASIAPDTVKSRIQTCHLVISGTTIAKDIYATRGLRGFFLGLEVAVLRAFPANAALFLGYEYSRKVVSSIGL